IVHHELTHAMMLRKYYGSGLQSVINGISRMPLPLWYIEGLAEYQSRFGWDYEADMYLRDAIVNDWLPPIDQFGGYLDYKGGQSVYWFLENRYGKEKIVDLVNRVKQYREFNRGVRASIGVDVEELSDKWKQWMKNELWPDAAKLESPRNFAMPLTDHKKQENYINNAPSISPNGDKIAFLSDKSDYFDIWLMNAYDGKIIKRLVSGERTSGFEELHWLQPGISWDPTGNYITFGAKADGRDALYILDTRNGNIERKFHFNLDGLYSPSWSPDGKKIAFQGWLHGKCDIFYVTIEDSVLHNLTNDYYSDLEPTWTPDSKSVLFTTDRVENSTLSDSSLLHSLTDHDTRLYDIYQVSIADKKSTRITNDPDRERTPVWVPGDSAFVYVSDRSGIFNLYYYDLRTQESKALTNVLTGVFQPSVSQQKSICFASFFDGGYDIYLMPSPLNPPHWKQPVTTSYRKTNPTYDPDPIATASVDSITIRDKFAAKFADYVFDDLRPGNKKKKPEPIDTVQVASGPDTITVYSTKKYRVKLSPDMLFASAGFSNLSGFQGMGQFMLSDVLGNHVIYLATDLYYDIENTNINGIYYYLPYRIDYGVGGFHNVYFFDYGWTRDRSYGANVEMQYPISKFLRIDFSTTFININRSRYTLDKEDYQQIASRHVLLPGIALVKDNSVWGYAGPANGERFRLSFYWSPDFDNNDPSQYGTKWGLDFKTAMLDYRRYFRLNKDYGFAVRSTAGFSDGKSPQRFFLGGEANSLNRGVASSAFVNNVNDVFFSTMVTPLRGSDLYESVGTRYALLNTEFRYPLIRLLALGWPIPAFFYNIRGASFVDVGGTWDNDNFRGSLPVESGAARLHDLKFGFGFGARASLGFAILKYDIAWKSDWIENSLPQHYISLGTEF
ncbi:MAG: hypothetical protein OEM52_04435, partial [bacterium]|nr:hypothetical protein [bacterium]